MSRRGEVVGKAVLPTGGTRLPRWLARWWRRMKGRRRRATRPLAVLPGDTALALPRDTDLVCIAVVDLSGHEELDAA